MKLTNLEEVKGIQANLHAVFDSPQGKEVMKFLELNCCWYQSVFVPADPNMTLINDGKRQVLATIKTILDLDANTITEIAKQQE